MSSLVQQTRWRIVAVPHWPNAISVELVVDTTARPVVTAIEDAATRAGVVLQRVSSVEAQEGE